MTRVLFFLALCVAAASAFVAPAQHAGKFWKATAGADRRWSLEVGCGASDVVAPAEPPPALVAAVTSGALVHSVLTQSSWCSFIASICQTIEHDPGRLCR
jgi:hypothetical protein